MSNAYENQSHPYSDYEVQPPGPSAYFQSNNYGDPSHYTAAAPGYDGYDKYEGALQLRLNIELSKASRRVQFL